jgi:hypothetical protein
LRSSTSAALTATPDEAMYNSSYAFGIGLDITAKFSMYNFKSSKACCCSGPHQNVPEPVSALKNGRLLSALFDMNLFSEANLPVNFYTSLCVLGAFMRRMALIFSGFASMPLFEIMQPNIFPLLIPKTHFSGFNLSPCR